MYSFNSKNSFRYCLRYYKVITGDTDEHFEEHLSILKLNEFRKYY